MLSLPTFRTCRAEGLLMKMRLSFALFSPAVQAQTNLDISSQETDHSHIVFSRAAYKTTNAIIYGLWTFMMCDFSLLYIIISWHLCECQELSRLSLTEKTECLVAALYSDSLQSSVCLN